MGLIVIYEWVFFLEDGEILKKFVRIGVLFFGLVVYVIFFVLSKIGGW